MSDQTTDPDLTTTAKPVAYLIRSKDGGDKQHVTLSEEEANILGMDDNLVVHPLGYLVPDISGLAVASVVGRIAELLTHVVVVGTTSTAAMDSIDDVGQDVLGPYSEAQAEAVRAVIQARFDDGEYEEPYGSPFVEVKKIEGRPAPDEPNWLAAGNVAVGLKLHAIADNWVKRED